MTAWHIVTGETELAVEAAWYQERIRLDAKVSAVSDPLATARADLEAGTNVGLAWDGAVAPSDLLELANLVRRSGTRLAIAMLGTEWDEIASLDLAQDLGLVAVAEVAPMVTACALLAAGAKRAWRSSLRQLPKVDRTRLQRLCQGARGAGSFVPLDDRLVGYTPTEGSDPTPVGEPRDVAVAVAALRCADRIESAPAPLSGPPDQAAMVDLLFGPARALSDPASKQALGFYGVPVPEEELCTSASRAASTAARFGFPVRLTLASPDLRAWDHPDLIEPGVDSAARVREVYRQLTTLGESRGGHILGVTVSADMPMMAALRITLEPLADGAVLTEIGFADPHGTASGDRTHTVLPAPGATIERALARLAGSPLFLNVSGSERRALVGRLCDLLLRLAAIVGEGSPYVQAIEADPVGILIDGKLEVREARIRVTNAFEQQLEAPA